MNDHGERKVLGIIGGMGPLATVDLFRRILAATPVRTEQEHLRILIDCDPSTEDRTLAIEGRGPSPLPKMAAAARRLVAAGAEFLAMPCNTAHYWYDDLCSAAGVPVLHMIRLTAQAAARHLPHATRFGLLATTGTVKAGLYEASFGERGLELLVPTPEQQQDLVMAAVYGEDGIKAGHLDGPPRDRADLAMAALVARGAEAIVLGCTELPLLYPDAEHDGVPLLNSTQVLAEACVEWGLGNVTAIMNS